MSLSSNTKAKTSSWLSWGTHGVRLSGMENGLTRVRSGQKLSTKNTELMTWTMVSSLCHLMHIWRTLVKHHFPWTILIYISIHKWNIHFSPLVINQHIKPLTLNSRSRRKFTARNLISESQWYSKVIDLPTIRTMSKDRSSSQANSISFWWVRVVSL